MHIFWMGIKIDGIVLFIFAIVRHPAKYVADSQFKGSENDGVFGRSLLVSRKLVSRANDECTIFSFGVIGS